MHQLLLTMPSSSPSCSKPLKFSPSSSNPNSFSSSSSSSFLCKHSLSATFDILILILVLFSGIFLLTSYFTYIFCSLSILLSHSSLHLHLSVNAPPLPYICGFLALFVTTFLLAEFCCGPRSRKCDRNGCKGLKKAMEFDLQLQTEDCVKSSDAREINKLPWKGGSEGNLDYEYLQAELRKMAPPNGRAVLLFRARCGCPVAKLEGWGPKKGRLHKNVFVMQSDWKQWRFRMLSDLGVRISAILVSNCIENRPISKIHG